MLCYFLTVCVCLQSSLCVSPCLSLYLITYFVQVSPSRVWLCHSHRLRCNITICLLVVLVSVIRKLFISNVFSAATMAAEPPPSRLCTIQFRFFHCNLQSKSRHDNSMCQHSSMHSIVSCNWRLSEYHYRVPLQLGMQSDLLRRIQLSRNNDQWSMELRCRSRRRLRGHELLP